jgi:TonB family protein
MVLIDSPATRKFPGNCARIGLSPLQRRFAMQPIDVSRARTARPAPPLVPHGTADARRWEAAPEPTQISIAGPALQVEAWFGEVLLSSRLLRVDDPRPFTIGPARNSDAPVNPGYLPSPSNGHALVAPTGDGGFALALAPAMRAALRTDVQRLPLLADAGAPLAPLTLLPETLIEVACGEMLFAIHPAEPAVPLPRPWLPTRWRDEIWYTLGVGFALLALLLVVRAVPDDERALSLDDLGRNLRIAPYKIIPPAITPPDTASAAATAQPGGGGTTPAKGERGAAGAHTAPQRDTRRAVVGPPGPKTQHEAAAQIRQHSILAALSDPKSGALAEVMSQTKAMGGDVADVMGHLEGTTIAEAYGTGGLHSLGTGDGGGGHGEAMIAGDGLGTWGRFGPGHGNGTGPGYGTGVGQLAMRKQPRTPEIIPGQVIGNGSLDKEIIRRIVRRHLNEVRFCYEQALPRHPTLAGRAVVQFMIGKDGQVMTSVLQSSTLSMASVESCVVTAVKRWPFPAPERGGLTIVSYPFQFAPGGG